MTALFLPGKTLSVKSELCAHDWIHSSFSPFFIFFSYRSSLLVVCFCLLLCFLFCFSVLFCCCCCYCCFVVVFCPDITLCGWLGSKPKYQLNWLVLLVNLWPPPPFLGDLEHKVLINFLFIEQGYFRNPWNHQARAAWQGSNNANDRKPVEITSWR